MPKPRGIGCDPGAETREPTKCTECSAPDIEAGLRAEAEAKNTYEVPAVPELQTRVTEPAVAAPEVMEPTQTEYARRNGAKRMTPFEIPDLAQAADVAAEFDPRCLENEEAHWQQRQAEAAEPEAGP